MEHAIEIFKGFGELSLPDAIDVLLFRVGAEEDPAGIERYARRVFSELDLPRLRDIASRTEVSLVRLDRSNNYYLNYSTENLAGEDVACLLGVEAALNRLSGVLDRMGCGLAPTMTSPSEEECSLLDQTGFMSIAGEVPQLVKRVGESNPWARPGMVACEPNGEWDVRTRFARFAEDLNVITRLVYRFDANVEAHELRVWFGATPACAMPTSLYDRELGDWKTASDAGLETSAREHDARLALVLAAAAFATGPAIEHVAVYSNAPYDKSIPSVAYRFERIPFMARFVPLANELETTALAEGACCKALSGLRSDDAYYSIAPFMSRVELGENPRELPPAVRDLLLADTAAELEVMEDPEDPYLQRFNELKDLTEVDPQKAAEGIAALIDELEAACVVKELTAPVPARAQFCEGYLARVLWRLVCDDPEARMVRVPDALYFAQQQLTEMILETGDCERALPESKKLYNMAQSSLQAHFQYINVLAHLDRYEEVVEVCRHGMVVAHQRDQVGYLFYRIAYAYWQLGKRELALACYSLIPRGDNMESAARDEMRGLMAEMGRTDSFSSDEVLALVEAEGFELPPREEVLDQIADAAVALTDAGLFKLAACCTTQMWRTSKKPELAMVSKSLWD